jgi:hypothetical protein
MSAQLASSIAEFSRVPNSTPSNPNGGRVGQRISARRDHDAQKRQWVCCKKLLHLAEPSNCCSLVKEPNFRF